jgi:hypothetical protein
MFAVGADLLSSKVRLAAMAFAMYTLTNFFVDQILSASLAGDCNPIHIITPTLLVTWGSLCGELLLPLVLGFLQRVTRTPLAPLMTTLLAGLLRAVGSIALVTSTMNSHANVLLNTFCLRRVGQR